MEKHCRQVSRAVNDIRNAIALRADIHRMFDEGSFAYVPKNGQMRFHFLSTQYIDPYTKYQNSYFSTEDIPFQFLFSRFAWAVFKNLHDMLGHNFDFDGMPKGDGSGAGDGDEDGGGDGDGDEGGDGDGDEGGDGDGDEGGDGDAGNGGSGGKPGNSKARPKRPRKGKQPELQSKKRKLRSSGKAEDDSRSQFPFFCKFLLTFVVRPQPS
jgi:hypothetical protein